MAGKRLLCLLLMVVLISGCEQVVPTPTEPPTPQSTPTETSLPTEPAPSPTATKEASWRQELFEANQKGQSAGHFGIIISSDRREVDAGEPVRIRLTVVNFDDETQVIEPKGEGPILDILVRYPSAADDRIGVRWSDGRQITPEMRRMVLAPGEFETIEMTWVPPDMIYSSPVALLGILNDQFRHGETAAYVSLCVEGGCVTY